MEISINSIHSQTMFPLSRHVYSAGLNVYNSSQSAGKIVGIVSAQGSSVAVNYNIGGKLNVYAWLKLLLIFCLEEKIFYIDKTFKKFNILKNFNTIIFAFFWFINNIFWNIIKNSFDKIHISTKFKFNNNGFIVFRFCYNINNRSFKINLCFRIN